MGKKSSGRCLKGRLLLQPAAVLLFIYYIRLFVSDMGLRCLVSASGTVLEVDGLSSLGFTGELGTRDKGGNLLCIVDI